MSLPKLSAETASRGGEINGRTKMPLTCAPDSKANATRQMDQTHFDPNRPQKTLKMRTRPRFSEAFHEERHDSTAADWLWEWRTRHPV
jgi:hypothetical protein